MSKSYRFTPHKVTKTTSGLWQALSHITVKNEMVRIFFFGKQFDNIKLKICIPSDPQISLLTIYPVDKHARV